MAKPLSPRQIFRYYTNHLSRSSQRSFHGGDGLSSNSAVSSKASLLSSFAYRSPTTPFAKSGFQRDTLMISNTSSLVSNEFKYSLPHLFRSARVLHPFCSRTFSTTENSAESTSLNSSSSISDFGPRIKFKRLDKTSRHIMQILDKEAVEEVKSRREIPDIRPGYIVQLKVEVPENKRRVSTLKGIIIARRNAGLNTTFRLRRLVAGVGVESLFPLYSPNIKEIQVLDKKKVRRAKLYYLRDKMNALKKH